MGGNASKLPIDGVITLAIACDAMDRSGIRVYRFRGTRGELEEGVAWDRVVKEGMTPGQNRTLANLVDDTAAGEIRKIAQFEIKLGDGDADNYTIGSESMDSTLRLFIQRKRDSPARAERDLGGFLLLDITLQVLTYNAHKSLKTDIQALVLSSPLFKMIHWPPVSVDAVMRRGQNTAIEKPSRDDPLRVIANNAGPHSADAMSTYDIIQFMLTYATDYLFPHDNIVDTENPRAMLHEFSDRVKGEEYKDLYLYDKNGGTIDPRGIEDKLDPRFRDFVLFVLGKFLDMNLSLNEKLIQYNKL